MKPITVGYGDEKITFYMKMISVQDEERYTLRYNDVSDVDPEKYEKHYTMYRDAIGEFSEKMPIVAANGKTSPLAKGSDVTPMSAVSERFKERTIENERILRAAYVLFRNQLDPEISFL